MSASSSFDCPSDLCGVWKQQKKRCESLCPLLAGLGISTTLQYIACPVADATHTTLHISCPEAGKLEIVDKTVLGKNSTVVTLDGSETAKKTKGRGKTFMLSGTVEERHDQMADGAVSVINCRREPQRRRPRAPFRTHPSCPTDPASVPAPLSSPCPPAARPSGSLSC